MATNFLELPEGPPTPGRIPGQKVGGQEASAKPHRAVLQLRAAGI